ncbi:MAG TPA: ABC-F family ATP-binding cassette domain-containing protein [Salinivirgaceae bacterium]|nr:ABC-F family ATP-binding cassette domain-containing protein [Salinivirgaceae bacterium]
MSPFLQVENLTKSYGIVELFSNISFSVFEKQRVGLIAQNGTGKTTLLRIIAGKETPDSGSVIFRNGLVVGYLSQHPELHLHKSIIENVLHGNPVSEVITRYEKAQHDNNLEALQKATELMDAHNAWNLEIEARKILTQLNLPDPNLIVDGLSGGQQKRVALAAVLVKHPDFFILDEPTNHLDLEMVEWLEDYLLKSQATMLMVTHDREFLDRVCNEIFEIDQKQLYSYKGNYSYFLEKRQERLAGEQANLERANNLYRRELEWIRQTPSARTGKAKYRIDAFEQIRQQTISNRIEKNIKISVKTERLGKKILEAKNISKRFGETVILNNFSYNFQRFERLGIVGKNGTGKSTFLNLLTGALSPDKGEIQVGETIVFGYYRQEGIEFNPEEKVIDALRKIAEVVKLNDGQTLSVSQFLNHFLFPPSVQNNYISTLSGGEKRRLYLCTVLMKNPNFLILDEPTNDLDIQTLQVLEEYLESFPGVVLVVSHDRRFLDKVVDGLLIFEGQGEISGFAGNYSDYYSWKMQQNKETQPTPLKQQDVENQRPKREYKNRLTFAEKKELEHLPSEIEALETEKRSLEAMFASGSMETYQGISPYERMKQILELLEEKEIRWLELMEKSENG